MHAALRRARLLDDDPDPGCDALAVTVSIIIRVIMCRDGQQRWEQSLRSGGVHERGRRAVTAVVHSYARL